MANFTGTFESDLIAGLPENDIILGLGGNDTLRGLVGNDYIAGNIGADLIEAADGDDQVDAGKDDDGVTGEAGNDTLSGNEGNDTIDGGLGNDIIIGNEDNDRLIGNEGNDLIFGNMGSDTLQGSGGNETLLGGRDEDRLFGEDGDDYLNGNLGNDTVEGGSGKDIVRGGQGNDRLFGDAGDDLLFGDLGSDTLTGGDGTDYFFLRKGVGGATIAEANFITDFVNGVDFIGLEGDVRYEDLSISQGIAEYAGSTVIQDVFSQEILAVLQGVSSNLINSADFANPGTLAFSDVRFQVNENGTPIAAVTVTRTGGSSGAASAVVSLSDGTATANADYNATPITVNFADGDAAPKTVTIPIVNDTLPEITETLNLNLERLTGNAFVEQNTAVLEIVDDEAKSTAKVTFQNPDGAASFGSTVVGAGKDVLIGSASDAVYLFDSFTGALLRKFSLPNQNQGQVFYRTDAIATLGNNVLIGAPNDDSAGTDAGAVYLFDRNTGAVLRTFVNPTPNANDNFGASITTAGNDVVISAPGDDTAGENKGAVYLFDGNTGALLQTFLNPNPSQSLIGSSIAVVGNNVLANAISFDPVTGNASTGTLYLFDRATGGVLRTFVNPVPLTSDRFGRDINVIGNNILTRGSEFVGTAGQEVVYRIDSATGSFVQTYRSPRPGQLIDFGDSITPVGNNILLGAPVEDAVRFDAGAAYLYNGTTGALTDTFISPRPSDDNNFGMSAAATNNGIVIGSDNGAYLF